MAIEAELETVWPSDISNRSAAIELCARHLARVFDVNRQMNLTRITDPREAAIKHVCDSLAIRGMVDEFDSFLDLGSGAGFPGIPLAIVYPRKQFVLAESVKKKARFLEDTVAALGLRNVTVTSDRAETWLSRKRVDVVIVRAVGNTDKLLRLLAPVTKSFQELWLMKGRKAEEEIADAAATAKAARLTADIPLRYELPDDLGAHNIVRYRKGKK